MAEKKAIYISEELYDRILNLSYSLEVRSISRLAEQLIEKALEEHTEATRLLINCWTQFAYTERDNEGRVLRRETMALSTLEEVKEYLMTSGVIDEKGLFEWERKEGNRQCKNK